jgi:hypothetical protein
MKARGFARVGLFASGLAVTAALACGGHDSLAGSVSIAKNGSYMVGGTPALSMGPGCERERKPNCNRPGRRSTRR